MATRPRPPKLSWMRHSPRAATESGQPWERGTNRHCAFWTNLASNAITRQWTIAAGRLYISFDKRQHRNQALLCASRRPVRARVGQPSVDSTGRRYAELDPAGLVIPPESGCAVRESRTIAV